MSIANPLGSKSCQRELSRMGAATEKPYSGHQRNEYFPQECRSHRRIEIAVRTTPFRRASGETAPSLMQLTCFCTGLVPSVKRKNRNGVRGNHNGQTFEAFV